LRNSKEFRKAFFELIAEKLGGQTELRLPDYGCDSLKIHTQLSFNSETNDDDDDPSQRRFDLVVQSEANNDFIIVFENKVSLV
jgi:hypothetical protein